MKSKTLIINLVVNTLNGFAFAFFDVQFIYLLMLVVIMNAYLSNEYWSGKIVEYMKVNYPHRYLKKPEFEERFGKPYYPFYSAFKRNNEDDDTLVSLKLEMKLTVIFFYTLPFLYFFAGVYFSFYWNK